eukprot:Rmarinus@m.4113
MGATLESSRSRELHREMSALTSYSMDSEIGVEPIRKLFEALLQKGASSVYLADIKPFLDKYHVALNQDVIRMMFDEADFRGDGKLDFDELCKEVSGRLKHRKMRDQWIGLVQLANGESKINVGPKQEHPGPAAENLMTAYEISDPILRPEHSGRRKSLRGSKKLHTDNTNQGMLSGASSPFEDPSQHEPIVEHKPPKRMDLNELIKSHKLSEEELKINSTVLDLSVLARKERALHADENDSEPEPALHRNVLTACTRVSSASSALPTAPAKKMGKSGAWPEFTQTLSSTRQTTDDGRTRGGGDDGHGSHHAAVAFFSFDAQAQFDATLKAAEDKSNDCEQEMAELALTQKGVVTRKKPVAENDSDSNTAPKRWGRKPIYESETLYATTGFGPSGRWMSQKDFVAKFHLPRNQELRRELAKQFLNDHGPYMPPSKIEFREEWVPGVDGKPAFRTLPNRSKPGSTFDSTRPLPPEFDVMHLEVGEGPGVGNPKDGVTANALRKIRRAKTVMGIESAALYDTQESRAAPYQGVHQVDVSQSVSNLVARTGTGLWADPGKTRHLRKEQASCTGRTNPSMCLTFRPKSKFTDIAGNQAQKLAQEPFPLPSSKIAYLDRKAAALLKQKEPKEFQRYFRRLTPIDRNVNLGFQMDPTPIAIT